MILLLHQIQQTLTGSNWGERLMSLPFKNNVKTIEFIPIEEDIEKFINAPQPSNKFIPNWYKESNSFITKDKIPVHYDLKLNTTFKRCIPILDSMTAGYIYSLPCDVYALNTSEYSSRFSLSPFSLEIVVDDHSVGQLQKYPILEKHSLFKWVFPYQIKTPPGYSCFFTHPNHRFDLPFTTLSGVVDTDLHPLAVQFPFILNNDFVGKIDFDTPLVQIFPFKRDVWKSKLNTKLKKDKSKLSFRKFSIDAYKKTVWQKKSYN
jgi:hypothetical protein